MTKACEHLVFEGESGWKGYRECGDPAAWEFVYDYVDPIRGRRHSGRTPLCQEHYEGQLAERPAMTDVHGTRTFERVPDPDDGA